MKKITISLLLITILVSTFSFKSNSKIHKYEYFPPKYLNEQTNNANGALASALRFILTEASKGVISKVAQDGFDEMVKGLYNWFSQGNNLLEVEHIIGQAEQPNVTIEHFQVCQVCNSAVHAMANNTPLYDVLPNLNNNNIRAIGNVLILNANGNNGSASRLSNYLSKQIPGITTTIGENWYGEGFLKAEKSIVYFISDDYEQLAHHIAKQLMPGTQYIFSYDEAKPFLALDGYDVVVFVGQETY